jgi:hypothetical protein
VALYSPAAAGLAFHGAIGIRAQKPRGAPRQGPVRLCNRVLKGAERKIQHKYFELYSAVLHRAAGLILSCTVVRRQCSYRTEDMGGPSTPISLSPFMVSLSFLRKCLRKVGICHVSLEFLQNRCLLVGSFLYLPACLLTYLLSYLPTYLLTYLPT